MVIITLGSTGAIATFGGNHAQVRPPQIQVVDTTGAGDALCGAFAAAIAAGSTPEQALKRGVAAGSAACATAGARRSRCRHPHRGFEKLLAQMR